MPKGTNTLVFNQDTMCEAIGHYLRTVVLREGTQVNVMLVSWDGRESKFSITIESPVEPPQ